MRCAGSTVMGMLLLAIWVAAASGRAEEESQLEPGFISLFNGKDLTGWRYKGSKENLEGKTETADARVAVENGILVMRAKDNMGKAGIKELATIKEFPGNFHLKLDFRASLKADSGVYIRGKQLQVRDYARRKEHQHLTQFKNDDWNSLDILVRKDAVVTIVNNQPLRSTDQFTLSYKEGRAVVTLNGKEITPRMVQVHRGPLAECLCNGEPLEVMIGIPTNGSIGLQAETGKFEFRRVRIKELD